MLKSQDFSHAKWLKTLVKFFKNRIFQKMIKIVWFVQKIENLKINFFHTKWVKILVKIFKNRILQKVLKIVWFGQKIRNFFVQSQLSSRELLETGGIHNLGYWKIAGLTACYFQGNFWKLGTLWNVKMLKSQLVVSYETVSFRPHCVLIR